ncbi:MAG: hypothetical protein WKF92_13615 [Pyrinomonadaceae bacterium]
MLNEHEKIVVRLAQERFGMHDRDEIFFLENGEAILQAWGNNGDGPWTNLTNIASMLSEGILDESEVGETQM